MSVQAIVEKIIKDAQGKAQEIIKEAEEKSREILTEAKKEIDKRTSRIIDTAKKEIDLEAHRLIVTARLKAQEELLLEKQIVLDRVFEDVKKRLVTLNFRPKKTLILKDKEVQEEDSLDSFLSQKRRSLEPEVAKILGL